MLEKIKLSMRIFHNVLDDDILSNVNACMLDLRRVGVSDDVTITETENALVCKAAELFYKWQVDYNGKGDQYQRAYEKLRDALSLCESYTGE